MTTITKEQVEEAITALAHPTKDPLRAALAARVGAYIAQLEANQRQPVSDEKLRVAVRDVENTNRPASDCGYSWPLIKDAISELETLRTKNAKLEERVKVLESATNRMKQVCRCPRADETCDSPGITLMQACIDEATLAGGKEGA